MTTTVIDTTFTGKDISSAVSLYEYTATALGTYRFQVRFAAVAGNGDYVIYLTLNDGDAQTDDPMEPRTTIAVPSGVTAFWSPTISIDLMAGDVVNVMAVGLAGDTSEAGSIRIFADNYATAADVVSTVAVTATTAAAANTGDLSITTYDTFSQAITSTITADLANVTKHWWSIKRLKTDPDSAALILVEKTGGLTVVNGATYATTANGTLVVSGSSGAWTITPGLDEVVTGMLPDGTYYTALKYLLSGNTVTYWEGECQISNGIIKAVA